MGPQPPLRAHLPFGYFSITFPRLTVLRLEDYLIRVIKKDQKSTEEPQDTNWAILIRCNPIVKDIDLYFSFGLGSKTSLALWGAFFEALYSPRPLVVSGNNIPLYHQRSFWRAVSRLEELNYTGMDPLEEESYKCADLGRLELLSFSLLMLRKSEKEQLDLFTRCNGLTMLFSRAHIEASRSIVFSYALRDQPGLRWTILSWSTLSSRMKTS